MPDHLTFRQAELEADLPGILLGLAPTTVVLDAAAVREAVAAWLVEHGALGDESAAALWAVYFDDGVRGERGRERGGEGARRIVQCLLAHTARCGRCTLTTG